MSEDCKRCEPLSVCEYHRGKAAANVERSREVDRLRADLERVTKEILRHKLQRDDDLQRAEAAEARCRELEQEWAEFALEIGYGERPEGQGHIIYASAVDVARAWKEREREHHALRDMHDEVNRRRSEAEAKLARAREALLFGANLLASHRYQWEHEGDEEGGEHDEDCRACEYEAMLARFEAALTDDAPAPTEPPAAPDPYCLPDAKGFIHCPTCRAGFVDHLPQTKPDPAPSAEPPTHRCKVCGGRWRLNPGQPHKYTADHPLHHETWSYKEARTCPPCCDQTTENLEPLQKPVTVSLLRDVLRRLHEEEISFSRAVEVLNEAHGCPHSGYLPPDEVERRVAQARADALEEAYRAARGNVTSEAAAGLTGWKDGYARGRAEAAAAILGVRDRALAKKPEGDGHG